MAIQNIPTHPLGCHAKVGIDVDIQGTTLVTAKSWQNHCIAYKVVWSSLAYKRARGPYLQNAADRKAIGTPESR